MPEPSRQSFIDAPLYVMDLSVKVARRFIAETLTRQWLLGVKKGWLSLLNPKIETYPDALIAVGDLDLFIRNLQEQVFNLRRGPYTSIEGESREQFKTAIKAIREALSDLKGRVQHWSDAYNGVGLAGMGPHARKDGEHMLRIYQTSFALQLNTTKYLRGGRSKTVPISDLFAAVLKPLNADADRIKNHNENHPNDPLEVTQDVFKEFAIGGMKIVILDENTNGSAIHTYVKLCDHAFQDLKRKGFGKVWYGAAFIILGQYKNLPEYVQKAYADAGYKDLQSVAGTYHSGKDVIELFNPPKASFYNTLVHEMGHRFWFKFMTPAKRAKFEMLIEGTYTKVHTILLNIDELGLSDEDKREVQTAYKNLERGLEPHPEVKDRLDGYYNQLGIHAGIPLASAYAKSSVAEAFAEVFERYVTEKELTRPQVEGFRAVISSVDPWKVASPLMEGDWA